MHFLNKTLKEFHFKYDLIYHKYYYYQMNIITKMWQRDMEILRWLKRKIIYPYYRFEHFRLTKTR